MPGAVDLSKVNTSVVSAASAVILVAGMIVGGTHKVDASIGEAIGQERASNAQVYATKVEVSEHAYQTRLDVAELKGEVRRLTAVVEALAKERERE